MANTKISDLTSLSGAGVANDDLLLIVDTSTNTTKKITLQEFLTSVDTLSFDTVNTSAAPATPTSAGIAGDNTFDGNYFYVCVAANTWKRVAWDVWT